MKMILKTMMIIGLFAASLLMIQFARADECKIGTTEDMIAGLAAQPGITGGKLANEAVNILIEKKGSPPGADDKPFDIYRYDATEQGVSILYIVQGECVNDSLGPVPTESLDRFLDTRKVDGKID